MASMQIKIPHGTMVAGSIIECRPDEHGYYMYVETDDGGPSEPLGVPLGARIHIEIVSQSTNTLKGTPAK